MASGAIAEKYLSQVHGVEIVAFVSSVGSEELFPPTTTHPTPATNPTFLKLLDTITREEVDHPDYLPVRCPNKEAASRMSEKIAEYRDKKDSIGGTVTCVIRNCPIGLGEPCFDKLEACLAQAMLSIPATKGFEIGSGFGGCAVPGSIHNDAFISSIPVAPSQSGVNGSPADAPPEPLTNGTAKAPSGGNRLKTKTNNSGGIQGGISNGAPIFFRVGFKPPATIGQAQSTVDFRGQEGILEAKGRHDPCVVPRAVAIVEAMSALVVMDALLTQGGRQVMRDALLQGH